MGDQHGVAVCDEICKDVTARMVEVEDWMTNFDVRIIKFDTSIEIGHNTMDVRAVYPNC